MVLHITKCNSIGKSPNDVNYNSKSHEQYLTDKANETNILTKGGNYGKSSRKNIKRVKMNPMQTYSHSHDSLHICQRSSSLQLHSDYISPTFKKK